MWRDERGIGSSLEDMLTFAVFCVTLAILLSSTMQAFSRYLEERQRIALQEDAREIAWSMLSLRGILHRAERGLFDEDALRKAKAEDLSAELNIVYAFCMQIRTISLDAFSEEIVLETGEPGRERASYFTSANIRQADGTVLPAKFLLLIWRP